jgi:predicted transcriptional regulator
MLSHLKIMVLIKYLKFTNPLSKNKALQIEMFRDMRRSKLRYYEDIICVLYNKEKTIDEIAFSLNMDCLILQVKLEFLLENNLVEKRNCNRVILFGLTKRGFAIFKTISISRKLAKLQINIQNIDNTLQTIHISSENGFKKK